MYKKNSSIETKADVSIDLLCDPAVIADEKRRLLTANDAFEQATGLGPYASARSRLIKTESPFKA